MFIARPPGPPRSNSQYQMAKMIMFVAQIAPPVRSSVSAEWMPSPLPGR